MESENDMMILYGSAAAGKSPRLSIFLPVLTVVCALKYYVTYENILLCYAKKTLKLIKTHVYSYMCPPL